MVGRGVGPGRPLPRGPGAASAAVALALAASGCLGRPALAPPMTAPSPPKPVKVALVLGAGSSKGFAHVGVVKVLASNGIPVGIVVGTSVGSLVGSLYAYGYDPFQLQRTAMDIDKVDIVDLTVPDNGFVKGERLEEYVNRMVRNTPIERFRIPFGAVATDIQGGRETLFTRGNAGTAVRASCAIPGVFRPVRIEGRTYVDGGVVSPVAADAARAMGADVVVAVDVSGEPDPEPPDGTVETVLQAVNIMYARLAAVQTARADVLVRPRVGHIGSADFSKRHEAILEGERAAVAALPAIREAIARAAAAGAAPAPPSRAAPAGEGAPDP